MLIRIPFLVFALVATSVAAEPYIIVQSTTSTQNSGLYDAILPQFRAAIGVDARVVAVGTGQAIKNARNCDGDVLLVHAKEAEEAFVAEGFGIERTDLMYNDFVLLGPATDPAGIAGSTDSAGALAALAADRAPFVSRGDDSGTHKAELALWEISGIDPRGASGSWYRETGQGMGATLTIAITMEAYVLVDRATWISHGAKGRHRIVVEGDPRLINQYGIIPVSPKACPNVRAEPARAFVEWMLSPVGQAAIAAFRVDGQQLFFPNAPQR